MPAKNNIIDAAGVNQSQVATLSKFFRQSGQTLAEFKKEIDALTPASKTELAEGAAVAMGWTVQPPENTAPAIAA